MMEAMALSAVSMFTADHDLFSRAREGKCISSHCKSKISDVGRAGEDNHRKLYCNVHYEVFVSKMREGDTMLTGYLKKRNFVKMLGAHFQLAFQTRFCVIAKDETGFACFYWYKNEDEFDGFFPYLGALPLNLCRFTQLKKDPARFAIQAAGHEHSFVFKARSVHGAPFPSSLSPHHPLSSPLSPPFPSLPLPSLALPPWLVCISLAFH